MIAAIPDFEVVGEARDGKEALLMAISLKPDLVMMDLSMPVMNGIEATRQVRRRLPQTRILVLTVQKSEEYVREALQAGANGYVLKDATYDELVSALRNVLDGKVYLSPDVSGQMVHNYLSGGTAEKPARPWDRLTTRERTIVKLVAEGRTTALQPKSSTSVPGRSRNTGPA